MDDTLPTDFMINAQIRIAAREGVPVTVLRRGHNASGTIILKINLLNGTARVLTQVRYTPRSSEVGKPCPEIPMGTIFKRNSLPTSELREPYGDELVWSPVSRTDPMAESDADLYLARQAEIDPDSWLLEIEDKQGRHWFPGRVMSL